MLLCSNNSLFVCARYFWQAIFASTGCILIHILTYWCWCAGDLKADWSEGFCGCFEVQGKKHTSLYSFLPSLAPHHKFCIGISVTGPWLCCVVACHVFPGDTESCLVVTSSLSCNAVIMPWCWLLLLIEVKVIFSVAGRWCMHLPVY